MPEKPPQVYLDYDQAAIDAAHDQAANATSREQLIKRRIRDSELTRLRIGEPERVAYGAPGLSDIYRFVSGATSEEFRMCIAAESKPSYSVAKRASRAAESLLIGTGLNRVLSPKVDALLGTYVSVYERSMN